MKINEGDLEMRERVYWVDNIKFIACCLVVFGHFFQSMVTSNIIPESELYNCVIQSITCFHVPLFFICSGFLFDLEYSIKEWNWKNNVIKKAVALLTPYFIFSTLTWVLKFIFSSDINNRLGGLLNTLFINPTAPYWYLATLFMFFVCIPKIKTFKGCISLLVISVLLKIIGIILGGQTTFILTMIPANMVWFAMGIFFSKGHIREFVDKNGYTVGIAEIVLLLFVIYSAVFFRTIRSNFSFYRFALGVIVSSCVIIIFVKYFNHDYLIRKYISELTMPIFLLHTVFAATIRSALFRLCINNAYVHIFVGIFISFFGPVAFYYCCKKIGRIDIIFYPTKYVRIVNNDTQTNR